MNIWLGFSLKAAKVLIREQELDIPERLLVPLTRMLMTSAMSRGNQVARMPIGHPKKGGKSQ